MKIEERLTPTAAYVRVSHQEQRLRGLSPDAQREALSRYAKEHGLKIVEWYEDLGVSGRKLIKKRPELQRMINDAEKGKFGRIIFIKLDRYFRSVAEYYECQKRLEAKNVQWTATEEKYDLTNASGRYWVTQKLSMAEYEADLTGERIDLVNEYKIRTGQALTGAGSQGIPFTVKTDAEGAKRVVKDPKTKELTEDYIEHFLTHHNKRQACIYVNEKHGTDYSYNSLAKILDDTKIYGHYKGNDNYCEGYVTKETFDLIQTLKKQNVKTSPTKRIYLFTGLITCPGCKRKLAGAFTGKHRVNRKGEKYELKKDYYLYRCNKHAKDISCDFSRRINEQKVEEFLLKQFDELVKCHIEVYDIVDVSDNTKNVEKIEAKIKGIKQEMKNVNISFRKNRMTEEEYDKEYEELEAQLQELESQLEPQEERDLSIYRDVLGSGWQNLYTILNKMNKRAFWRKYIKEIRVDHNCNITEIIFF